ncbi:MAG: N-acetyltransferase, partial [Lachnoanaerobaculum gingivalis]
MKLLKSVNVSGQHCDILISDENVALWEAFNSHKATIAVLGKEDIDISVSKYAVESLEDIDEEYIKKVACRILGMPFNIDKVEGINIREMRPDDFEILSQFREFPFKTKNDLQEYISFHYDFYGYGLYVFENDNEFMGLAGFYNKDGKCRSAWRTHGRKYCGRPDMFAARGRTHPASR